MDLEDLHRAMMETLGIGTLQPSLASSEKQPEDSRIAGDDDEVRFLGIVKKRKKEPDDFAPDKKPGEKLAEDEGIEESVKSPLTKKMKISQIRKKTNEQPRKKLFGDPQSSASQGATEIDRREQPDLMASSQGKLNDRSSPSDGEEVCPEANDELGGALDKLSTSHVESCLTPTNQYRCHKGSANMSQSPATSEQDDSGIYEDSSTPAAKTKRSKNIITEEESEDRRRSVMQVAESYMRRSYLADSAVKDFSRRINILLQYLEDNCESFCRDDLVDYSSPRFKLLPTHLADFLPEDRRNVILSSRGLTATAYTKLTNAIAADMDEKGFRHRQLERNSVVWKKERADDLELKLQEVDKKRDPIDVLNRYMSGELRHEMKELAGDHKLLLERVKKDPAEALSSVLHFIVFELLLCTGGQGSEIICSVTDGDWMEAESDEWHTTVTVRGKEKLVFPKEFKRWIDNYVDIVRPRLLSKNREWYEGGRGLLNPDLPVFVTSEGGQKFQSLDHVCREVQVMMGIHPGDVVHPDTLRKAMMAWAAKSYPDDIIRLNFAFQNYAEGPEF